MPRPRLYASNAEKQRAYRAARKQREQQQATDALPRPPGIANMAAKRRWNTLLDQAKNNLETLRDEMQAYYDDRSEAWQESDRGQAMEERIEALEALIQDIDELPTV